MRFELNGREGQCRGDERGEILNCKFEFSIDKLQQDTRSSRHDSAGFEGLIQSTEGDSFAAPTCVEICISSWKIAKGAQISKNRR